MPIWVISLVAALAAVMVARLGWVWFRYRGARVITCPENDRHAGVELNSLQAAISGFAGPPKLTLSSCSRWPERAGCGQECLSQIHASPEGCLVRHILSGWYAGKSCSSCGRPFESIDWLGAKPGLRNGPIPLQWDEISPDKLYEVLAASKPLCFACCMANSLVREHPELVVARPASK